MEMAFKKPAIYQQTAGANGVSNNLENDVNEAIAKLLGQKQLGDWSSDHIQEGKSFQGWNYLAIAAIGRQAARAHGYVYSSEPKLAAKRKAAIRTWGSKWKSMAQDGSADTVGDDNWVARMVDQPNRSQSGSLFRWEFIQQMHLHGACLIWNRPGMDGSRTAARYIIPLAITQPVRPGEYATCPNGGVRVQYFSAGLGFVTDPLLRLLSGAILPIENLSVIRYPHPSLRGDGKSPTDAGGWWIDSALMVDMVRWKHLKRGPRPMGFVTFDDAQISPEQLDAAEKRINRKLSDEDSDQKALALGGGAKLDRDTPPVDMEYVQAFDQIGQAILALHGVGKSMVGLTENQTYGGNAAAMQMAQAVVQGDLDLLAGEWTQLVQDEGAKVVVEFETQPLDDPTLVEQQLGTDLTAGIRTGREWRSVRGLPPFGDWRDDARVTSQGFVVDDKQPPQKQEQAPQQQATGGPAAPPSPFARSLSLAKAIPRPGAKPGPVVAVDLDGTLAKYDGGFDADYIGEPIPSAIDKVARLKRAGCRIVIFTCRDDDETLRGWLEMAGVPYDAINENPDMSRAEMGSGKVMADVYWDDRAVNAAEGLDSIAALLPDGYARQKLIQPRASESVGIVMLELPPDVVDGVRTEQSRIDPDDMTGDGLEEWPHVTLLYGIVGVPLAEVVDQVRRLDAIDVTFGPSSVFANESDILKIEVHGPAIHAANAKLSGVLPVETTFPDYQPHVTLAELSPGAPFDPRSGLIGRAATLTHAVVVVGEQRVRVPLRMTGQAIASQSPGQTGYPIPAETADRMVSVAKSQNILDRAKTQFADMESEKTDAKLADMSKALSEFQRSYGEQMESLKKAMADIVSFARSDPAPPIVEADEPDEKPEPATEPPPEQEPEVVVEPEADTPELVAAGLAVLAKDTGRLLMLQRALDETDPASGTWEFPGGHIEPGEEPLAAAQREWSEETGAVLPQGVLSAEWDHGIYRGYVWTIGSESDVAVNLSPDHRKVLNPDDPDIDCIEVAAWFSLEQLLDNSSLRQELQDSIGSVVAAVQAAHLPADESSPDSGPVEPVADAEAVEPMVDTTVETEDGADRLPE